MRDIRELISSAIKRRIPFPVDIPAQFEEKTEFDRNHMAVIRMFRLSLTASVIHKEGDSSDFERATAAACEMFDHELFGQTKNELRPIFYNLRDNLAAKGFIKELGQLDEIYNIIFRKY